MKPSVNTEGFFVFYRMAKSYFVALNKPVI